MLQLPSSTPTPPLAQMVALSGLFTFREPYGQGKSTELGLETQLLEKSVQCPTYPGTFAERQLLWPALYACSPPACLGSASSLTWSAGVRESADSSPSKLLCFGHCGLGFGDLRVGAESTPSVCQNPF